MIDEDGPQDEVDLALADLAIAAVHRLHTEMNTARNSKDRIAAANSILDRVGYSRTPRAQADVADKEIRSALKAALRRGVSPDVMQELEDMSHEEKMRRIEMAQEEAEQRQREARELGPDDEETDKWLHA